MKERLKELRKSLNMTQEQFADNLKLSRNYIAQIELGSKNPSDRTIFDICRVYHVSEEWLRTGAGDMYSLAEDQTAAIVSDLLEEDSPMNRLILSVLDRYRQLDPVSREVIDGFIDSLLEERS